jgi:ribonuclease P protein component
MTGPARTMTTDAHKRWGFLRLTRRDEFTRVARGARASAHCLVVQSARRPAPHETPGPRFGLTVTKKTGGAVERNRIRRRLRAALGAGAALVQPGEHDYVIVARREALDAPFDRLCADLKLALERVHKAPQRDGRRRRASSNRANPPDGSTRP